MPASLPQLVLKAASLYIRLSDAAGADNLSLEGMERDCRDLAAENDLEVVALHIDDGLSGAIRDRPAFVEWLADGRDGRADTLIAWHTDRMTREGVNVAALILDVVEGKNSTTGKVSRNTVRLMDTKGLDSEGDETAFRFRFVFAAEIAREERKRMSHRSSSATRRLQSSGRWMGGLPPFGYRIVPNPNGPGTVLDIAPSEALFILELMRQALSGASRLSMTRWANSPEGHPPRRGSQWYWTSIWQVLTGYPVTGRVMMRLPGSTSEMKPVIGHDGIPVRFPAILTADESAALKRVLSASKPGQAYARKATMLLAGLIHCNSCGVRLYCVPIKQKTKTPKPNVLTYRCQLGLLAGCNAPVSIVCSLADGFVSEHFLSRYGEEPYMTRHVSVSGAAELEAAELHRSSMLAVLDHEMTPQAFANLQAADEALKELNSRPKVEAQVTLIPSGRTMREQWSAEDTVDGRRALLTANVMTIMLMREPPGKRVSRKDPFNDPLLAGRFTIVDIAPYAEDANALPLGRLALNLSDF